LLILKDFFGSFLNFSYQRLAVSLQPALTDSALSAQLRIPLTRTLPLTSKSSFC